MSDDKRMNISDEAVEAAAKAIEEATATWLYPLSGEGADAVARAALEAATQLVTAPAWDASADEAAARWWMHEVGVEDVKARNPYRSAGAGE